LLYQLVTNDLKYKIMCGIVCAFDLKQKSEDLRPQILEMSKTIRHRGPDWSGIYSDDKAIMAHERLAIVDPASGKQPLFSPDKKLVLAANFVFDFSVSRQN
jgi:asparagine synthase (glutamine-hydrolysing)